LPHKELIEPALSGHRADLSPVFPFMEPAKSCGHWLGGTICLDSAGGVRDIICAQAAKEAGGWFQRASLLLQL
jgi:hypothetical protein